MSFFQKLITTTIAVVLMQIMAVVTASAEVNQEDGMSSGQLPPTFPAIFLPMDIKNNDRAGVLGLATMEAVRREYVRERGIDFRYNWLEILHSNLELFRIELANAAGFPDASWKVISRLDPEGVQAVVDVLGLPPLNSWVDLDLTDYDQYYTASALFVGNRNFHEAQDLVYLAEEKYRKVLAKASDLPPDISWESLFMDKFFQTASDRTMAAVNAEEWEHLPELAISEFYRRMHGLQQKRLPHTTWLGHISQDVRLSKEFIAFEVGQTPDSTWREILAADEAFVVGFFVGDGRPSPLMWQDIDSDDEEKVRLALAVLSDAPSSATFAELEWYAEEYYRKQIINMLRLKADSSWTEIFIYDTFSYQANRGLNTALKPLQR